MPRYAAVDIGSNSVRLLVAEADAHGPQLQVTRLAEDRQVTRLGESVFRNGSISETAMTEVCAVLERMRGIWQRHEVSGVRAVATSATRDASNKEEFLRRASQAIGTEIEVISGQEEARLIQLGVQSRWPHPQERVLILDVGGGSAELILSEGGRLAAAYSRPLGAVRLQESFLESDPPTPTQIDRMQDYIEEKLAPAIVGLSGKKVDRVIATSSTAAALVSAARGIDRARRAEADRQRASRGEIRKLWGQLRRLALAERRRIPGIGPRRAEIIIPGVAVFLSILEALRLPSLYYSAAGVRDGIVADLAFRRVGRDYAALSVEQRRAAQALAKRFGVDVRHARKIANLAQSLFMSLQPLHRLPVYFSKLLEAAAYLLDIGHAVSETAHHKHSYYIVAHADLPSFTESERQFVALLCRYHRKAMPSLRHADFQALRLEARHALVLLIPILRLANGLDRTGEIHVESVGCEINDSRVILTLRSNLETSLEQWAVEQVAEPFRMVYNRELNVRVVRQ